MRTVAVLPMVMAAMLAPSCATRVVKSQPEPPQGIVCQPPDCDDSRWLPRDDLQRADSTLVGVVKNIPVNVLDPELPGMTFEQWLSATLVPFIEPPRSWVANWTLSFCEDRLSSVPGPSPDLCVEVSVPISLSKSVMFVIAVAERRDLDREDGGWIQQTPSIRDIYIGHHQGGAVDSLDVARLTALASQLQVPQERWPAADLRSAITWSPQTWKPGDIVQFGIWIDNIGVRDAARAEVQILVGISLPDGNEMTELRRNWFPRIRAGQRVGFVISARLPRGDAMVSVSASPMATLKGIREVNPNDNDTGVAVGLELVRGAPPRTTP